jgi:hypothetical protein
MPYTVEVRRIGADLAASMAEMRMWLDDNRMTPTEFDHSTGGPGAAFRLVFRAEREAVAFAEAFRGTLNDGREPQWVLPPGESPGSGATPDSGWSG